jgi:LysR family transcriptional regulator, glycine cleavage system transcriptional activator
MKSLIAFESVVRLGSVTKAAEELFVTHGAISKQIAVLENWIGKPLFQHNRKGMQPSPEALVLAKAASQSWDLIDDAVRALRGDRGATVLRVLAPSTFAMRWLIPRAWSFSERYEDIAIQVRQTDSLENWLDIAFDVAIRSDQEVPAHLTATQFLQDDLILAISPRAPAMAKLHLPADLTKVQILRALTRQGELDTWLTAAGVNPGTTRSSAFPHFYLALEAALAGAGPLVCPLETLGDLLVKGELVEPWPHIRVPGPRYAAIYDSSSVRAKSALTFVKWLADTGRTSVRTAR